MYRYVTFRLRLIHPLLTALSAIGTDAASRDQ
jgi:hypothetical protein